MDNNWNNTQNHDPDDTQGNAQGGQPETSAVHTEPDMETTKLDSEERTAETYSDPNAGYSYGQQNPYSQQDPYGRQNTYGGQNSYGQYQTYNQQQNPNWGQDNYNYNVGNNTGYNRSYDTGMDNSPMSLGDWVLTILALMIPCAGIILYFVWAFGKNGNINRRNYCRAYLIITGITLVIYIIIIAIFGAAIIGSLGSARYY